MPYMCNRDKHYVVGTRNTTTTDLNPMQIRSNHLGSLIDLCVLLYLLIADRFGDSDPYGIVYWNNERIGQTPIIQVIENDNISCREMSLFTDSITAYCTGQPQPTVGIHGTILMYKLTLLLFWPINFNGRIVCSNHWF